MSFINPNGNDSVLLTQQSAAVKAPRKQRWVGCLAKGHFYTGHEASGILTINRGAYKRILYSMRFSRPPKENPLSLCVKKHLWSLRH